MDDYLISMGQVICHFLIVSTVLKAVWLGPLEELDAQIWYLQYQYCSRIWMKFELYA